MFKKIINIKCNNCSIGKKELKGDVKSLDKNIGCIRRGKIENEVLIVLSRYETDKYIDKFELYLKKYKINSYVIIGGLDCSISSIKDYTQHEIYKYCNAVDLNRFPNLKCILTIGSGLFAITKSSDLTHWAEFKEFIFNQTYFYTGFDSDRNLRVYALPYLDEILKFNSFERNFTEKQLEFVKGHLTTCIK